MAVRVIRTDEESVIAAHDGGATAIGIHEEHAGMTPMTRARID